MTIITSQCVSTCCLSVVITMSEQVFSSAVTQHINFKFVTNENVKLPESLTRLRTHFDNEAFSRTQICNWNNYFKEDRTQTENMRTLRLLQESNGQHFLELSRRLIH